MIKSFFSWEIKFFIMCKTVFTPHYLSAESGNSCGRCIDTGVIEIRDKTRLVPKMMDLPSIVSTYAFPQGAYRLVFLWNRNSADYDFSPITAQYNILPKGFNADGDIPHVCSH